MTRGAAEFEVAAIGGGHRGRGSGVAAVIAVLVMAVVIGGGVLSSALFPPAAVTPSPDSVTATPPPSVIAVVPTGEVAIETPSPMPLPAPSPSMTPRVAVQPLSALATARVVHDGVLDGRVVFVRGVLHATPRRCPTGAIISACVALRIDGLPGVPVIADGSLAAWRGEPAPQAVLVLRVAGRGLVYMGSILLVPTDIPGTARLTAPVWPGSNLNPAADIVEADGLLVRNDDTLCFGSVTSCGRPAPFILPTWQFSAGAIRYGEPIPVALAPLVAGIDPADSWTSGPFLLRRLGEGDCALAGSCPAGPSWVVVARETPGGVVSIGIGPP